MKVPPPDPSWPPAAGGSAPRPSLPYDLTHIYCTTTKRFKFVALFNEGFKEKFLVKTFFEKTHYTFGNILFCFEHSDRFSPPPNCFVLLRL